MVVETFSSRIWRVFRTDGSSAIVKDLKPFDDIEDELRGANYLHYRGGDGAVRIFDLKGRQMLLEDAGNRSLLDIFREQGDEKATEIAARLLGNLLSPTPNPVSAQLLPLRQRFQALFEKASRDFAGEYAPLYRDAANTAIALLSTSRQTVALHADLHHENIMQSARGWLAIDPKGVLGDPAFDAANLFYNPLGEDALCADERRIGRTASTLARATGQDALHILQFAFTYGCLSAAWHAEDSNVVEEKRALAIASAIRGSIERHVSR